MTWLGFFIETSRSLLIAQQVEEAMLLNEITCNLFCTSDQSAVGVKEAKVRTSRANTFIYDFIQKNALSNSQLLPFLSRFFFFFAEKFTCWMLEAFVWSVCVALCSLCQNEGVHRRGKLNNWLMSKGNIRLVLRCTQLPVFFCFVFFFVFFALSFTSHFSGQKVTNLKK